MAFTIPAFAAEGSAKNDWERVGHILPTQKVIVHLRDGKTVSGKIKDVGPEGLTLIRRNKPVDLRRADIAEIGRRSRLKGALGGAAVGGGIGFAIGAAKAVDLLDMNNPSAANRVGMGGMIGALFGGIGAAIGAAGGAEVTLYEAERLPKAKRAP